MWVTSLFSLLFLPSFESEFLNVWLWHIERSHTEIWHDLYKYCLKHWPGWKVLFPFHKCSVFLSASLWVVAVASHLSCVSAYQWVLCHLTTCWKQTSLSPLISVKLNAGRCAGTLYSTPGSFAFLKLIGLKDFFFLFATAALETVH